MSGITSEIMLGGGAGGSRVGGGDDKQTKPKALTWQ